MPIEKDENGESEIHIPENKRNRKKTKRGRKRLFDQVIHELRITVERTFAWEDKFKRLLLRFERIPSRHFTFKLLVYTMINLRQFCQAKSYLILPNHYVFKKQFIPASKSSQFYDFETLKLAISYIE